MAKEVNPGLRKWPVYLVLDCSSSMSGEPIEAVRRGMRLIVNDLKNDPQALDNVWLSVITFGSGVQQIVPLTEVGSFTEPSLAASGSTALGEALRTVSKCIDKDVRKTTSTQKGDWKPDIILMTHDQPADSWEGAADELKKRKIGNIIACAAGPGAGDAVLKRLTECVVRLADISPDLVRAFFRRIIDD